MAKWWLPWERRYASDDEMLAPDEEAAERSDERAARADHTIAAVTAVLYALFIWSNLR